MSAPVTDGKSWTHHRAVLAVSVRDGNHEAAEQARRAMRLAQTEHAIRTAIERAPPLDAATLARLRSLIPAAPAEGTE